MLLQCCTVYNCTHCCNSVVLYTLVHSAATVFYCIHLYTQVPDYRMNFHHLWIFLSSTLTLQLFLFPAKENGFKIRKEHKNMKWISIHYYFYVLIFSVTFSESSSSSSVGDIFLSATLDITGSFGVSKKFL